MKTDKLPVTVMLQGLLSQGDYLPYNKMTDTVSTGKLVVQLANLLAEQSEGTSHTLKQLLNNNCYLVDDYLEQVADEFMADISGNPSDKLYPLHASDYVHLLKTKFNGSNLMRTNRFDSNVMSIVDEHQLPYKPLLNVQYKLKLLQVLTMPTADITGLAERISDRLSKGNLQVSFGPLPIEYYLNKNPKQGEKLTKILELFYADDRRELLFNNLTNKAIRTLLTDMDIELSSILYTYCKASLNYYGMEYAQLKDEQPLTLYQMLNDYYEPLDSYLHGVTDTTSVSAEELAIKLRIVYEHGTAGTTASYEQVKGWITAKCPKATDKIAELELSGQQALEGFSQDKVPELPDFTAMAQELLGHGNPNVKDEL